MPDETSVIRIRRPREQEGPACRMLLPNEGPLRSSREFLIAAQDRAPFIVGAVAFRFGPGVLHSLRLRVVRTHRRLGIGSRLLEAAIAEARNRGFRAVLTRIDTQADPDAPAFLGAHGFTLRGRFWMVEADARRIYDHLVPLRRRLLAARALPDAASFVKFADAPQDQVARLYVEHIAGNPHLQPEQVRAAMLNREVDASPVLLVNGRVEGMLLWSIERQRAHVHAWVVTPGHRDTFASPMLLAQAIEEACAAGAKTIAFEYVDQNRNTARVARRYGAETRKVLDRFVLPLAPELHSPLPMRSD